MRSLLHRSAKAILEFSLPTAERLAGFRTPRGGYLPNRIRMLFGKYEAAEIRLMKQFLRPGQTIVDVGANVGYLTSFFARSAGPNGKVLAFEPNPNIFSLLQENTARFTQVSAYNVALSNTSGELPLFIAGTDQSVGSFAREYPATHVFYQKSGILRSVAAKLVNGDEFLTQLEVKTIDILKLDVEGWEVSALNGLERTIAASPRLTIFCEFNPSAQECAGWCRIDLVNWFLDRRFNLFRARAGHLEPISLASAGDFIDEVEPGRFATLFATAE